MITEVGPVRDRFVGKPCPYCGTPMAEADPANRRPDSVTRDHALIPAAKGGLLQRGNTIICCRRCNNDKADTPLGQWIVHLIATKDKRAAFAAAALEQLEKIEAAHGWHPPRKATVAK